ncbi:MAG: zinc-binding dehydrogenase [Planctomycetia bacterium]|nr:zinc-binding dehydrogenase [Planctomycetia bacterium]
MYGPRKIRLVDVPEPKLRGPDEIIFQVELACLCGSDLVYFENDYPEFPPVVGHSLHEMIGRVKETSGTRFQPGDRVLCVPVNQEGLFERFGVSQDRAIPLDPRPSPDEALLAQPLGTVLYALRKLPNLLGLDVAVVGQGPIGQLFNLALRNLGARQIIAIDLLESRLAVSPQTGANVVVNASRQDPAAAVKEATGGAMADVVIEAVGHRDLALNLCVELCRREGKVVFFGVPPAVVNSVNAFALWRKNVTVVASVNPDFAIDFPLAMRWIAEKRVDVRPVITHRFKLAEIQKAFDVFSERRDGALKVFVEFPALESRL